MAFLYPITPNDALKNGTITTYIAGTTTPVNCYKDKDELDAYDYIINLNEFGTTNTGIWLKEEFRYKFIFKSSAGEVVQSLDNVSTTLFTIDKDLHLYGDIILNGHSIKGTQDNPDIYFESPGSVFIDNLTLSGDVVTDGDILFSGSLEVEGDTTIGGSIEVSLGGTLDVTGDTTIGGNLEVSSGGTLDVTGDTTIGGSLEVSSGGTLDVTGDIISEGSVDLSSGILDVTGDTTIGGNLEVSLGGTLDVTGDTTISGGVSVGGILESTYITTEDITTDIITVNNSLLIQDSKIKDHQGTTLLSFVSPGPSGDYLLFSYTEDSVEIKPNNPSSDLILSAESNNIHMTSSIVCYGDINVGGDIYANNTVFNIDTEEFTLRSSPVSGIDIRPEGVYIGAEPGGIDEGPIVGIKTQGSISNTPRDDILITEKVVMDTIQSRGDSGVRIRYVTGDRITNLPFTDGNVVGIEYTNISLTEDNSGVVVFYDKISIPTHTSGAEDIILRVYNSTSEWSTSGTVYATGDVPTPLLSPSTGRSLNYSGFSYEADPGIYIRCCVNHIEHTMTINLFSPLSPSKTLVYSFYNVGDNTNPLYLIDRIRIGFEFSGPILDDCVSEGFRTYDSTY